MNQPNGYQPPNPMGQQQWQQPQAGQQPQQHWQQPQQQQWQQPAQQAQQHQWQQPAQQPQQQAWQQPQQPQQAWQQPQQPQQAWQQPQQPAAQPGLTGPTFGLGMGPGGNVRINMQGGDFSPTALVSGVMTGQGFANPRMLGLGLFALSLLFGIGNLILIFGLHYYFPYFLLLAGPFGWGGLFMAITGQPKKQENGAKAPMWSLAGLGGCLLFGFLLGVGSVFAVHH